MTNASKEKGSRAEREVAQLLTEHLGVSARRKLGAGRHDDQGDIDGVPLTVIQVANIARLNVAVRDKPLDAETQRQRAGEPFAATFIRLKGGDYRVVLLPSQYFALWREATS